MAEQHLQDQLDQISDYLHGDAREHVAQSIAQAGNEQLHEVIAAVTYEILGQTSESEDIHDIEDLLYLATETIDFMIEIAEAVGAAVGDLDDLRAMSLISVVELHMAAVEGDPEQRAIAEEVLAEMVNDGSFDEGAGYINEKIQQHGGDPGQAEMQGIQMAQQGPQPDPLAQGVQQGLQQPQGGGLLG